MTALGYALGFGPLWIPAVPVPCQSDPDAWFPEVGGSDQLALDEVGA